MIVPGYYRHLNGHVVRVIGEASDRMSGRRYVVFHPLEPDLREQPEMHVEPFVQFDQVVTYRVSPTRFVQFPRWSFIGKLAQDAALRLDEPPNAEHANAALHIGEDALGLQAAALEAARKAVRPSEVGR